MQTRATIDSLLAERVGFEPTNTVRCYTLSRRAPSTARPPLHKSHSTQSAQWAGLTRAILALALRARCARPKSLPAILSNPRTRLGVTHFPGVRLRPLGHLSTRAQGYRTRTTRSNLAAGGLIGRCGLVPRRHVEAGVFGPRRRRRKLHGRDDQGVLGVGRIEAGRDLQGSHLASPL